MGDYFGIEFFYSCTCLYSRRLWRPEDGAGRDISVVSFPTK